MNPRPHALKLGLFLLATTIVALTFQNCSRVRLRSIDNASSSSGANSASVTNDHPDGPNGNDQTVINAQSCPALGPAIIPAITSMAACRAVIQQTLTTGRLFNPANGLGAPHRDGTNFCGQTESFFAGGTGGTAVNLDVAGADFIGGNSVQVLSSGKIGKIEGTTVFVKAPNAEVVTGNAVQIIADTVGTINGTVVVAAARTIAEFGRSNTICASVDQIGRIESMFNTMFVFPRTSERGEIETLDIRLSNSVILSNMHVKTLVECPSRIHLDQGRVKLDNSSYDNLILKGGSCAP